jgi:hypothetical protein
MGFLIRDSAHHGMGSDGEGVAENRAVIPGHVQRVRAKRGPMTGSAANPESKDSPMCNRTSEVCALWRIPE